MPRWEGQTCLLASGAQASTARIQVDPTRFCKQSDLNYNPPTLFNFATLIISMSEASKSIWLECCYVVVEFHTQRPQFSWHRLFHENTSI
jgi:hypothetical protein